MVSGVKKSYLKSGFRSLKATFSRFLAIFAIVALGVGFLAGLLASPADMRASAENYYDETDMHDIRVVSTQGLTEADYQLVQQIEGIEAIYAAKDTDVVVNTADGGTLVARLHTLPETETAIDTPVLTAGRMPEKPGEILLLQTKTLTEGAAKLGDVLLVSAENDTLPDDFVQELTVVGIGKSSLYLSLEGERTTVGSGTVDLFCYTSAATVNADYYTAFYLTVAGAKPLDSFGEEYDAQIQPVLDALDDIKDERADLRYNQIVDEANAEIADAKAEYEDGKAEAETELADAKSKLDDAKKQLDDAAKTLTDGEAELAQKRKDYDQTMKDSRQQLADGWAEIAQGEAQSAEGKKQLDAAQKQLTDGKAQLDEGQVLLDEQAANLEQLRTSKTLLNVLAHLLQPDYTDDPNKTEVGQMQDKADVVIAAIDAVLTGDWQSNLPEGGTQIPGEIGEALKTQLATARESMVQLKDGLAQLEANGITSLDGLEQTLAEQQALIDKNRAELDAGQKTLDEKTAELNDGLVQLAEGRAKLAAGEKALQEGIILADDGFTDAEKLLADGRTEYEEGLAEYEEGLAEYNEGKAEADAELADAANKIADAEQDIRELTVGEWYLLDRNDNTSFASYDSNADKIANIAQVFPVFFFLVAALVALTTMTRMVEEERMQIGTLKALGYAQGVIAAKYIVYALVAAALGSVFGMLVGMKLFPFIIVSAYNIMYDIPTVLTPFHASYGLIGAVAAIGCTLVATISACRSALAERPAQLMQPKAPKAGKRIFLEHITPLWGKMKFTYKVTARNLLLYKKRFFMTVAGIAGCTALLVTGFGVKDSISDIVHLQFDELSEYQLIVAMEDAETLDDTEMQTLLSDGRITSYLPVMQNAGVVVPEKGNPADEINILVPSNATLLNDYFNFRHRKGGEAVTFDTDAVIVSEKLAERQGWKVGDTILLENKDGNRGEVTITDITENYVQHYVYLSANRYAAVFGQRAEYTTLYCKLAPSVADSATETALATDLLSIEGVQGSQYTVELAGTFNDTIAAMDGIVLVLIVAAGLLAFIVLYNLTNINIAERTKEIATIKVLGFYDNEVSAYIFRETAVLTVIGALVGLLFGTALHQFVMRTAEIDMVMFGRSIYPLSYLYSGLLTLLFGVIVSAFMNKKLKNISMVESMKAPE